MLCTLMILLVHNYLYSNQLENQEVGSYDDEGTSLSPPVEQQTSSPIQGTSSSIQGSNSSSPRDNSSSYFSLSRQGSSSSYSEEIRSPYFPQGANLPDFTRVHQRTSSPSSVLAHQGTSSPSFTPTYQGNQRSSSPSSVLVRQGTSSLSSTPTLQGNHQGKLTIFCSCPSGNRLTIIYSYSSGEPSRS